MAVGNLMEPQEDHAVRICRFAMDAIDAANNTPSASQLAAPQASMRVCVADAVLWLRGAAA